MAAIRNYRELSSDLKERLKQNYRMARALPEFFRRQVTTAHAEEEIKKFLENRGKDFSN